VTVNCSTPFPTGGKTCTGNGCYGTADGLVYGTWANGSGGIITYFPNARAFGASWNNGGDFLAWNGLDFDGTKSTTFYGTITAQFVETKTGTAGGYSFIGMYGWMGNPCVEWYIVDDSFNGLGQTSTKATIDGATYYLRTNMTTGTGGNNCEAGHKGPWVQMYSFRQAARQCGTITVSDHFAAWKNQGWTLGDLRSVHVQVEVGGGTGSVQFAVADVTTH
jgi:hypothetical protein